MTKDALIQIRCSKEDKKLFEDYCKSKGKSMSSVLMSFIRSNGVSKSAKLTVPPPEKKPPPNSSTHRYSQFMALKHIYIEKGHTPEVAGKMAMDVVNKN